MKSLLLSKEKSLIRVIRTMFGIIMIYYGWQKVKDLKANAEEFEKMGFKPGWFWGTNVAFLEFFGSILIISGKMVPILGPLFAAHMATGTVWKLIIKKKPFTDYSYDLLVMMNALLLPLHHQKKSPDESVNVKDNC